MQCINVLYPIEDAAYVLSNTYKCDRWPVPHIITPMLWGLMARWPLLGFIMAGLGELPEVIFVSIFGSFAIYPNANTIGENMADSLLDDWLIQGGIGFLLSFLMLYFIPSPRMLQWQDLFPRQVARGSSRYYNSTPRHIGRFVFYLVYMIFMIAPVLLYGIDLNNGYKLGTLILPAANILVTIIFALLQRPLLKQDNPWRTYSKAQQVEFWATYLVFITILNVQNGFNYFYSNAVQSWLWSAFFILYILVRASTLVHTSKRDDQSFY